MNSKIAGRKFTLDQYAPSWTFYMIIAIGAILRLIALKSDPPLDLAKGQSLWTDPSQYVFFARNFVEFGHMDNFIPSGLIFFKYSFISFLSIPIFYLLGTGFWQSNFVSSIVSISAIAVFSVTIRKSLGNFAGCLAALFAGTSYIVVMHNRVPYLENASLLFLAFSAYFFILKYDAKYGLALSGVFLACSILIGKTLAVLTVPAFAVTLFIIARQDSNWLRNYIAAVLKMSAGFLAFTIVALILFYLPNYFASREYLAENVINYYGFPDGLKSVSGFIQSLYTFDLVNFENAFFDRMSVITVCAVLFLATIRIRKREVHEKRSLLLFAFWFIAGYLFLSPWNYRPVRYEMYLVLPMIALATIFLKDVVSGNVMMDRRSMIIAIIPNSLIAFHVYFNISHVGQSRYLPFWEMFGYSIVVGIMLSPILYYIFKGLKRVKPEFRAVAILVIILLSLGFDLSYFIKWSRKLTYAIDYVNRTLKSEVSDKAVIMGPYAQTLTLGAPNRAEIFYFGAYPKDDSLFRRIPATHVVYEVGMGGSKSGNETKFAENYPRANAGSEQIDSYLIGRYYVSLYNVANGTDNISARSYKMTDFEKAMYYYNRNVLDTALVYFDRAGSADKVNRAFLYIGNIYYKQGKFELAKTEYSKALSDDCYDPKFWALYSLACRQAGDISTAEMAKEKAVAYAPFPGFFQNANF